MLRKLLFHTLCLSALVFAAPPSQALEAGALRVFSQVGQPLVAEIPVRGTAAELDELSARMASIEVYSRASITRSALAAGVSLSIERSAPDSALILLRSVTAVPEGKNTLLLDLRWPGGNVVRGYAFALDGAAEAAVNTPQASAPSTAPARSARAAAATPPPAQASTEAGEAGREYRTQAGDTLGSIAQHQAAGQISVGQMMAAIYLQNPQQFVDGDPDRLRPGSTLKMPELEAARVRSNAAARALLRQAAAEARGEPRSEAPAATPRASSGARLHIGNSDTPAPEGRLLALEAGLASQSQMLSDRDARLRSLEEAVQQLTELVALQRQQLAALGAQSQPVAAEPADAAPLAISHRLFSAPVDDGASHEDLPWYRQRWLQIGVVAFALLMFSAMLLSEVNYRLAERRRRKRRAARRARRPAQT